jgi:hypothetical protein
MEKVGGNAGGIVVEKSFFEFSDRLLGQKKPRYRFCQTKSLQNCHTYLNLKRAL